MKRGILTDYILEEKVYSVSIGQFFTIKKFYCTDEKLSITYRGGKKEGMQEERKEGRREERNKKRKTHKDFIT